MGGEPLPDQEPVDTEPAGQALVFVHSPLVGSLTWQTVADRFTANGYQCLVPDLAGAMTGPGPYLPRIAATVARATDAVAAPIVLIGHSGAGPLLPALATTWACSPPPTR